MVHVWEMINLSKIQINSIYQTKIKDPVHYVHTPGFKRPQKARYE